MKKIIFCMVAILLTIGSNSFAQCYNGRCYSRYYRGSCYSGNCSSGNCYSGNCSTKTYNASKPEGCATCTDNSCYETNPCEPVSEIPGCDLSEKTDYPYLKTMELHKEVSETSDQYKPENDGLLYAKCVECNTMLGFRVTESDKHSCPRCKAWYRYFDGKLWYEVKTEKKIVKVPVTNSIQLQVFEEINKMRRSRGLSPVSYDESIEYGAQSHSVNMSRRHSCDHNDPTNGCAEICASWQTSPLAAVTAWLYSRGHAAIMLSARYTRCAVGVATDNYGRKYWTARFK